MPSSLCRAPPEPREVRRALLEECPRSFLLLLGPELWPGAIPAQLVALLEQRTELLHERGLQDSEARRGEGEELGTPPVDLLVELRHRDDGVYQAHIVGLLRGIPARQHPHLASPLGPDHAREIAHDATAGRAADPRPVLAEYRVLGRDSEVAVVGDVVAGAHRIAVHPRDNGLRAVRERFVEPVRLEDLALETA